MAISARLRLTPSSESSALRAPRASYTTTESGLNDFSRAVFRVASAMVRATSRVSSVTTGSPWEVVIMQTRRFSPRGGVPRRQPCGHGLALVQGHLGDVVGRHGVGQHALDSDDLRMAVDLLRRVEANALRGGGNALPD